MQILHVRIGKNEKTANAAGGNPAPGKTQKKRIERKPSSKRRKGKGFKKKNGLE